MRRMVSGSGILAVLLALLGGGATYVAIAGGAAADAAPEPVVVAAHDIPVGRRLTEADLRVDASAVADLAVPIARSVNQVVGQYATRPMVSGEPVILTKVSEAAPGGSLSVLIPAGRVAISVAVSDVMRTGRFIAPGDHVDVLGVVSKDAGDVAQLVLTDITVLAVSSTAVGDSAPSDRGRDQDNPKSLDTTVTLAVTEGEARRLVQVDEVGRLRLALRPRTGP